MFNKVYYIIKSELHYYPPCVSQIRMLHDAGVEVVSVYGSSKASAIELLRNDRIECVELVDHRGKYKGKWGKIYSWLTYRNSLLQFLKHIDRKNSLLWFGNVESYLPLYGHLSKYHTAVSFLELLDLRSWKSSFTGHIVKSNEFVTACEETRAYVMKDAWALDKLPYVLPNKPYSINITKNAIPSIQETKDILAKLGNAKYIVYQGIFQNIEYISAVAKALKKEFPDFYFVLMGLDRNNVIPSIKKLNPNIIYVPYIPAPKHLEITSHAYIGLLFYEPFHLNRAFCAPNKIYEYSSFGLPIIGNNIPGLKNTIGTAHAGLCIDINEENVINAIKYINEHYEEISNSAYDFYESTDNVEVVNQIIADHGILTKDTSCTR